MLTGIHLAIDTPAENEDVGQEWYMNKSSKSTSVKVLHFVSEGLCKMRLMEDLLRGHHMPNPMQPICQDSTHRGSFSVANAVKVDCDSICDSGILFTKTLTEADEDDDIGKMTLKEMQRLLRRNAQKSSKKRSSAVFSSVPLSEAGSNLGSKACISETLPSSECSLQLGVLELHLDSSTSISAESGDDVSPRCVATSCHKSIDSVVVKYEAQEDYGPNLTNKKRKSMTGPLLSENGISLDDDECTLQMWQAYRRRSCGGKRSGGRAAEPPACRMTEQGPSESPLTPAVTLEVCSINTAPEESPSVCASDGVALKKCDSEPFTLSCPVVCEDPKENSSLMFSHDAIAEDGSLDNGQDFKVESKEMGKTCKEDDVSKQGLSSMVYLSSLTCSTEGSPKKINARKNPPSACTSSWTLRPCKGTDVSACVLSKVDNTHIIRQEPIISCQITQDSNESARLVGQSPAIEEACTNVCSQVNSDSTGMESTMLPSQVIGKAAIVCEHADKEIASCSSKLSIKESFPVRCPEDSFPSFEEPQTGLSNIEKSSQNVVSVSQLCNDETSGSPVSLFSTGRLDAEEQELEQLKPSKIPCKRKAISPLSRERLLQASKFGERERAFDEVDKRGLKKLPRAFKGFIGRDTSNHERINLSAKARSNFVMESSPPEKLLQKEEDLPGSPCHNRKKFLSAKSYLLKTSSPASYGDSVAATTMASPVPASLPSPTCVQRLSLVLNSSPSPASQHNPKPINGKSPTSLSPSIPTKGILRSSPPTCQGACKCEECVSLRCRAERAAEFSQRQMQDIEGLAVRLLKELNTMRCVVEESLIQRSVPRVDSPRSALSSEQVRRAANNAFETEKMAKSWLVRMARDCNRYCKIMRMQERKLTFADESGGQLCHVKLFRSQPKPQPDAMLLNAVKENTAISVSLGREDSCQYESELGNDIHVERLP